MAFLPGYFEEVANYYGWTHTQKIVSLAIDYLVIGTYGILVVLGLRNIYEILFKQKEYKNLPILMFYIYAMVAVIIRFFTVLFLWEFSSFINCIDLVQQAAKLSVGVVQDWITLELAIRIHHSKVNTEISEAGQKKLRIARSVLFAILTIFFVAFSLYVFISEDLDRDNEKAIKDRVYHVWLIFGYLFLTQVIVMTLLVIWLFVEV